MGKETSRITAFDRRIGRNLRALRRALELSQQQIADIMGVSFQQVQKYESGKNRMSAEKLYRLHCHLGVPYEQMFGDCGPFFANPNSTIL